MRTVAIWAAILLAGGWGLFLVGAFAYILFDSLAWVFAKWRVGRRYR